MTNPCPFANSSKLKVAGAIGVVYDDEVMEHQRSREIDISRANSIGRHVSRVKLTCGSTLECSIMFGLFLPYKILGTWFLTRNLGDPPRDIEFV